MNGFKSDYGTQDGHDFWKKMQSLMHLCLLGMTYTAVLEGLGFFWTFHLIFPRQLAPTGDQSSQSQSSVLVVCWVRNLQKRSGQVAIALLIPNPRFAINALMWPFKYICHHTFHAKSDSNINCSYTEHNCDYLYYEYIWLWSQLVLLHATGNNSGRLHTQKIAEEVLVKG